MHDTMLSRMNRRQPRVGQAWIGGVVLILLGIFFLLQQTARFSVHNWWAAFILVPALGSMATAYALYRRFGFSHVVRGNAFGALIFLAIGLMFLFEVSWFTYWPIFVILTGLSLMLAGLPVGDSQPRFMRLFAGPWLVCLGIAATLIGASFLLQNLGVFQPAGLLGERWWSLGILLTAAGGAVATVLLVCADNRSLAAVISNLLGTVVVAGIGLVAYLGLDWNLLWPSALIALGAVLMLGAFGGHQPGDV